MPVTAKKTAAAKKTTAKKETAAKKTTAKKPVTASRKTTAKKTAAAKKPAVKKAAKVPAEPVPALVELCEKVAYERKAENILRLSMKGIDTAQSDYYLLCTGLSEPHIGAIAEHIRRAAREQLAIRPILCNGDQQSHWIIVDFGVVIIHIMTADAREKYQLEELWGDAPRLDIVAKLDKEAKKRLAAAEKAAKNAEKAE